MGLGEKGSLVTEETVKSRRVPVVAVIFLVAVGVRLLAAWLLNDYLTRVAGRVYLIEGDAEGYWILAQKLVAGETYALYHPERYAMRMPGFPAVLAAAINLVGDSQTAVRYVLAVLTSLAVFPVFWMAERLWSRQAGIAAGLLIAFMPVYIGFSVTILTECLFAAAIVWNVWGTARMLDAAEETKSRRSAWQKLFGWACFVGLSAGLAVYFRPSWLLFPVLFAGGWCCLKPRLWAPIGASTACAVGVMLLTLLPWGWRNQQMTGHFVLTSLWMGPSLYDGLHPGATGDSDMTFFEQDRVLERMSEFEMNQHYKQLAWQYAREHPGRALELAGIKFWRYWKPWPNAEQFQHPLLGWGVACGYLFLLFWAIRGGWALRSRPEFVLLCLLPIVYFSGLHLLFVSSLRYRLPVEFPLAVLAGIGLSAAFRQQQNSTSRGPVSPAESQISSSAESPPSDPVNAPRKNHAAQQTVKSATRGVCVNSGLNGDAKSAAAAGNGVRNTVRNARGKVIGSDSNRLVMRIAGACDPSKFRASGEHGRHAAFIFRQIPCLKTTGIIPERKRPVELSKTFLFPAETGGCGRENASAERFRVLAMRQAAGGAVHFREVISDAIVSVPVPTWVDSPSGCRIAKADLVWLYRRIADGARDCLADVIQRRGSGPVVGLVAAGSLFNGYDSPHVAAGFS